MTAGTALIARRITSTSVTRIRSGAAAARTGAPRPRRRSRSTPARTRRRSPTATTARSQGPRRTARRPSPGSPQAADRVAEDLLRGAGRDLAEVVDQRLGRRAADEPEDRDEY